MISVLDLALVFALGDAGFAYFALSADHKPVVAVLVPAAGLLLVLSATLAPSERWGARLLLGASLVLGAGFSAAFVTGHPAAAPFHDSILLTDAAADRLVHGRNPYGQDYLLTAARYFYTPDVPVNFGIRHYVYPPGLILLDSPLRAWAAAGGPNVGAAILYAPAFAGLAFAAYALRGGPVTGAASVAALALNPLMVADTDLQFFNDVFFLAPLVGCVAALQRGRPRLGWLLLGVALCFKQQPVTVLPFLLLYSGRRFDRRTLAWCAALAVLPGLAISLPFAAWDARGFFGDVAAFFYGSGVDNYPIRGLGLPGILYEAGLIANRWAAFPSAAFQLVATGGLLTWSIVSLHRRWTWPRFWFAGAAVSFSLFFFGRVLAPNYIDFVLVLATAGLVLLLNPAVTLRRLPAHASENLVPAVAGVRPDP